MGIIGNEQVFFGHIGMTSQISDHRIRERYRNGASCSQAIKTVGQVYRIRAANNNQCKKWDIQVAHIEQRLLRKRKGNFTNLHGCINHGITHAKLLGFKEQKRSSNTADCHLPEELDPTSDTIRAL